MFRNLMTRPETFSRKGGSSSEKVFIRKVKNNPNAVSTYTGFENYGALITVFKCSKPKARTMYFWQNGDKCNNRTVKHQNENTTKS